MNNLFYYFCLDLAIIINAFLTYCIIDYLWTALPILMIILITIPTFAILFELDKLHKILIKLVAIGNQWFWT